MNDPRTMLKMMLMTLAAAACLMLMSLASACSNPNMVKQSTAGPDEATAVTVESPSLRTAGPLAEQNPADLKFGTASLESTGTDLAPPSTHTVYFEYDSATLSESARDTLGEIAEWLDANPDERLMISGHTDDAGTVEYNIALGFERARTTHDYLVDLGVAPERLQILSMGEEQPAHARSDALNRRSEFERID